MSKWLLLDILLYALEDYFRTCDTHPIIDSDCEVCLYGQSAKVYFYGDESESYYLTHLNMLGVDKVLTPEELQTNIAKQTGMTIDKLKKTWRHTRNVVYDKT